VLELNGTPQFMVYADDVNVIHEDMNVINKNTVALLEASRKVGLEVNTKITKYMVVSRHEISGEDQNLLIANKYFENVAKFRYL
jgi:hypothetical protein